MHYSRDLVWQNQESLIQSDQLFKPSGIDFHERIVSIGYVHAILRYSDRPEFE